MKDLLKQYAVYNIWASQQILNVILNLSEEQQFAELPSSFSSLYKTIFHMWDAESIWWQRMKMQERINRPSENEKASMKDVAEGLLQQSKQWAEWVSKASGLSIEHVFHYQDTKRVQYKQPIYEMLLHVFNHSTYHRGQLINQLRQLGIEKLPSTDFVTWTRGRRV